MSELLERITINPDICFGKPVIRGLSYPVHFVLELLASGMTQSEILADHEDLEPADISVNAIVAYRRVSANLMTTIAKKHILKALYPPRLSTMRNRGILLSTNSGHRKCQASVVISGRCRYQK